MNAPTRDDYIQFSKSKIWEKQGHFYKQAGIDAWNEKVPYQVTNNLTIVNSYANVIFSFFKEYSGMQPTDTEPNPFIIVELGAGSGMFGFYLIKRLVELQNNLNRPDLDFKYIMTDFSTKNIDFWRRHPALREYLDLQILDFAEYDIGEASTLKLLESGRNLKHTTYGGKYSKPWIVIANYAFDTLPQDIFQIEDGNVREGLISKKIPEFNDKIPASNEPKSFQEIGMNLEYHPVDLPYYKDRHFDSILSTYKDTLPKQNFLFPIKALKGINNLLRLSGQKLLLLATDKASSHQPPSISEETQDIVFHDASFSMVVNFHAIDAFFQSIGGKSLHQPIPEYITTSLFLAGKGLEFLYETEQSFSTFLINYNPFSLFSSYGQLEQFIHTYSAGDLLSYFNLTHWDPEVINRCINIIVTTTKELDATSIRPFIEGMRRCADNFYYLPGSTSTLVNVGTFFQEVKDFETALEYYQKSIDYFGKKPSQILNHTLYNMGLCYYHLDQREAALEHFRLANQASPTPDMVAKGWIYYLTKEAPKSKK